MMRSASYLITLQVVRRNRRTNLFRGLQVDHKLELDNCFSFTCPNSQAK